MFGFDGIRHLRDKKALRKAVSVPPRGIPYEWTVEGLTLEPEFVDLKVRDLEAGTGKSDTKVRV